MRYGRNDQIALLIVCLLQMAALGSFNLYFFSSQKCMLYKLEKSSIPYFFNFQIVRKKGLQ